MRGAKEKIRVRLAPSPTGAFHFGTARTALFNWLFARQHTGTFVVRMEDTDAARSKPEYEDNLMQGLSWLGLSWDEGPDWKDEKGKRHREKGKHGPYRQSERKKKYRMYLRALLESHNAYVCYCTKEEIEAQRESMLAEGLPPRYNGHCRALESPPEGRAPQAIRFRTPEIRVEFRDLIRGNVSFDAALFGDFIIAKGEDSPLYNFAVVVDDELMSITHVIRGEDHLPNTPKQILLQSALKFRELAYAHVPLILGSDRSKLSKRYAETSLLAYREKGFLPDAMVNFLALLGWHPKDNREILSREELVSAFDLKRIQKSGAIFDGEKLEWMNAERLHAMSDAAILEAMLENPEFEKRIREMRVEKARLLKILSVEKQRMKTLADFFELASFFVELPGYESALLLWQKDPRKKTAAILKELLVILEMNAATAPCDRAALEKALAPITKREGNGSVLWPLRVALSGKAASPDPYEIIGVLGCAESAARVRLAIEKLEKIA
ncbi:MAG: glutamate--tRNA ligase [Candidatus Liptonbacteria bacterium]|nr:glutamate--tRNA ligase [Candidatus Liptonbacteria bacterium]